MHNLFVKSSFSWLERCIIKEEGNVYEFLKEHMFHGNDFEVKDSVPTLSSNKVSKCNRIL